jgi:hypothetical protein
MPGRPSLFAFRALLPESGKVLKASAIAAFPSARRISSAVEQRFCKPLVGGSIPSSGTKNNRYFKGIYEFVAGRRLSEYSERSGNGARHVGTNSGTVDGAGAGCCSSSILALLISASV